MMRTIVRTAALAAAIGALCGPSRPQSNSRLQAFLRRNIRLDDEQIRAIQNGEPVAKALPSRKPDEVFLFGAVYIHATPEAYLSYARDFDRLRKLPGYLALGVFGNPPQASDLKEFAFDRDDIEAAKNCKPGNCMIQAPARSIEEFHRAIDWSAPDADEQANRLLRKSALQLLVAYQRDGNPALGVYNDKRDPTVVAEQFAYMLSYSKALPERLPDFNQYLLSYPRGRPSNVEDTFYWAKVKFGLKPTLRIVHMVTMRGKPDDEVACATAEKQLYSSHYFETALDLSFCVRASDDPAKPGFYLITAMGSEQAGLTGVKGAIVRKTAVGRSVSNLRQALATIQNTLEAGQ